MKQMKLWMPAAICLRGMMILSLCGLTMLTSCTNDDNPIDKPDTADEVRLASMHTEFNYGLFSATGDVENTWKNGLLTYQVNTTSAMGVTATLGETFVYENGLCVEQHSDDGKFHHYYSYDNRRLAKEVSIINDHISSDTEVLAYDANGNIAEMQYTFYNPETIRKYHLTWQDGDLVKAVTEYVSESLPDLINTWEYDNYPSAFTGYPLATCIYDLQALAQRGSRHNLIEPDYTPAYENGRLVSVVAEDGSFYHFTYTDGTGQQ